MIDLNRYKRNDGNEVTTAEGLESNKENMTTEEKAKAYNKAIQKAKDYYNEKTKINSELSKVLELIFPELKKSEDERIKEEIIDFLNLPHPQFVGKRDYKDWIAWLEKQGKQKPTWSEYDDKMMYYTNEFLKYHENSDPTATSCIRWLESLKPQNSNEESNKFEPFYSFKNDNECMCESIIDVLTNNTVLGSKGGEIYSKYIEWLKSLRDTKILVEKDDEIKK